jgi:hypothetical protein
MSEHLDAAEKNNAVVDHAVTLETVALLVDELAEETKGRAQKVMLEAAAEMLRAHTELDLQLQPAPSDSNGELFTVTGKENGIKIEILYETPTGEDDPYSFECHVTVLDSNTDSGVSVKSNWHSFPPTDINDGIELTEDKVRLGMGDGFEEFVRI